MKVSENWLRAWVNPQIDSADLAKLLTQAGLEVESLSPVCPDFSGVVIGEVLEVEAHPNADRLRVCQVKVGPVAPLQIVCGAKNVAPGLRVPVAMIGAELPNGFHIKASQLRGVDSNGMLCAADELGLESVNDGLMLLPIDAPIGANLRDYLDLNDKMIEIGLTPNRADCLSVKGVAREVAALTAKPFIGPHLEALQDVIPFSQHKLKVFAERACPAYYGLVIQGLNLEAKTPLWLCERLKRSGIRPLHPIIDITQYVMLELGQPLHAYDLARLSGDISVRFAEKGETCQLLDGKTVDLKEDTLIIADEEKVLALAGIMGGFSSSVTNSTQAIFLESAFFTPAMIAGRARQYGLHTEAAHRFERGVDPSIGQVALARAEQLILAICGGESLGGHQQVFAENLPIASPILLRLAMIKAYLGYDIPLNFIEEKLTALGFKLTNLGEGTWSVLSPSYRFDIRLEADLIEEVARCYGYDNIPQTLPNMKGCAHSYYAKPMGFFQLKSLLAARNYSEVITYSFVDPEIQMLFDPATPGYTLKNPLSTELSVMRTSLWQSLIRVYQDNIARQQSRIRIFEQGLRFVPSTQGVEQISSLAGLISGNLYSEQWGTPSRAVDFYDVKQDVTALLSLRGDGAKLDWLPADLLSLHPGRSALIKRGHEILGYLGEIHPSLWEPLGLKEPIYLFELNTDLLCQVEKPFFKPFSKYPAIRRDLCLILARQITVDKIVALIRELCDPILISVEVFDVYEGESIGSDSRSLAFSLLFQALDRTLHDEEISDKMERVLFALNETFNAVLRQ